MSGHKPVDRDEIKRRIAETGDISYTTDLNEEVFNPGTVFSSFHYQAGFPVSDKGLIPRFLMLWLKRSIVPSLLKDAIAINVVYPVVLLAYG